MSSKDLKFTIVYSDLPEGLHGGGGGGGTWPSRQWRGAWSLYMTIVSSSYGNPNTGDLMLLRALKDWLSPETLYQQICMHTIKQNKELK